MPEINVPFNHGQNEGSDPKLLPPGWFVSAQNVRIRKDGRLGSRYGYAYIGNGVAAGPMVAAGNLGAKRSVYVQERSSSSVPAAPFDRRGDSFGVVAICGSTAGTASSSAMSTSTLGVPLRIPVSRNVRYSVVASDIAVTATGNIFVVFQDFDYVGGTNNGIFTACFNPASNTPFVAQLLTTGGRNPKVVVSGSTVFVVWATTTNDDIKYSTFDNGGNFGATGTLVTARAGLNFYFDVAPAPGGQFALIYEQPGTDNLNWGTVNASTFVYSSKGTQAVVTSPARPSIAIATSTKIAVVWAEGATFNSGNVFYLVEAFGGTPIIAKTAIDSSGLAVGFPVAGANTTDDYSFAWNRSDHALGTFTPSIGTAKNMGWMAVVSKPFMGPNNGCYIWCANYATTGQTASFATYKLVDIESVAQRLTGASCEAVACQHQAMPGAYLTTNATNQSYIENRRFSCAPATILPTAPSATAVSHCLPVFDGLRFGVDLVRMDSSPWADRLLTANINGQLFFSGARVYEYDGTFVYESGLGDGPEYVTAVDAGAGSLGAGTYQYVVTWEWRDAAGRRHSSPPSTPQSVTIGAGRNVTVSFSPPPFSCKSATSNSFRPGVTFNVYRTLAGGSIFYLVNSSSPIIITANTYDATLYTYTDSSVDATIAVNEVLYTQGARGGLSGLLPNDEPPPCRFIWAGNNRLILGGLEQPNSVQWSKLVFPGEPVHFSIDPGFKARIDGDVMGVACLDGTWFVGSRNSIFAFDGIGPDDSGGGGSFGDPRKLPADIGFYSQRSIVEIPQGLLFQGRSDRIYLLPRGQNAPVWIGQPVRDTLALYPFIAAAKLLPDENIVVFSCLNSAGTDGVLIVYDTRNGEWTVDVPFNGAAASNRVFHCIDVYDGKLVLDGQIAETSSYADDEDGSHSRAIVGTLTTGDIRPFPGGKPGDPGQLVHGRWRRAVLLSEYRSATTFTLEVSIDGGATYSTPASYTPANSVGDTVKTAYDIPIVKAENWRFRITSTPTSPGEGMVFNGMTGEIWQDKGTPRLADAYRA